MNTSDVLREVRRAINKGWWNISNSYLLHDKPLSEILGAIDRAIALEEMETTRRKIVTLCGSVRFQKDFGKANKMFTLAGIIVLAPGCFDHARLHQPERNAELIKDGLDKLHKDKILMSDFIYVINRDGYVGKSTQTEIDYAEAIGKSVLYMEEDAE